MSSDENEKKEWNDYSALWVFGCVVSLGVLVGAVAVPVLIPETHVGGLDLTSEKLFYLGAVTGGLLAIAGWVKGRRWGRKKK